MREAAAGFLIQPLDHRQRAVAEQIHAVMRPAYAQEAQLLQVQQKLQHFPPLETTVEDVQRSVEFHLGAWSGDSLQGVVSVGPDDEPDQLCIGMLVVHHLAQRQGIARALMQDALRRGAGMVYAVATGAANAPALALYRELGFVAYRQGSMGTAHMGSAQLALVKLRRDATA